MAAGFSSIIKKKVLFLNELGLVTVYDDIPMS